jgi:hypothetical protein
MTTPTCNNTTTKNQALAGSIVINAPASIVEGDLLLAFILCSSSTGVSAPTGWYSLGFSSNLLGILVKPITYAAGEPSTYTFTSLGGNICSTGVITRIHGAALPFAWQGGVTNSNGTSANYTAPSLTTTKDAASLLVCAYASAGTAGAITKPAGQTDIANVTGNGATMDVAYENLAALGATGTRVATGTSANNYACSIAFPKVGFDDGVGTVGLYTVGATPTDDRIKVGARQPGSTGVDNAIMSNQIAVKRYPAWSNRYWQKLSQLSGGGAGSLSGTVSIGGVPQANVLMGLYARDSGLLIGTTTTASNGTYSFANLAKNLSSDTSLIVMAIDPNGLGQQYNSLEYDRLIPG